LKKIGSKRVGAHYNPNNIDPRDVAAGGEVDPGNIAGVATNYGMPKI